MKKLLSFAMAAVLLMASCVKENISLNGEGGEVNVTFTTQLPISVEVSRAIADGSQAVNVHYAIYDANNNNKFLKSGDVTAEHNVARIDLNLIKGEKYNIAFWAQANGAPYSYDNNSATVTANYNGALSNNEKFDAFFAVEKELVVNGPVAKQITLYRPFAQVNLGVPASELADAASLGVELKKSAVTFKNLANEFNLLANTISGDAEVTFAANAFPTETLTVNGTGYKWLAFNYVLAPAENTDVADVTFEFSNDSKTLQPQNIPAVNFKRNHRTNILGRLITGTASFEVFIDKTPMNDFVNVWDGVSVTEPAVAQGETNVYEIKETTELAWLAAAVNGTLEEEYTRSEVAPNDFAGKTFRLTKNIDLNGHEWTPIGSSNHIFKGTFDGQGHTIKNLVITGKNSDVGLFGVTHDGELKNFTVENATVSGRLNVGVVAGQPYTSKYTDITVKGHVEVNGMSYVGGVGGKNAYADWTNVKVEVTDNTSYVRAHSIENDKAYRSYVGGVVGFNGEGGHKFSNITSNIDVKGSTCDVGGLFGIAHYGNQFDNCTCSGDVEIYAAEEEDKELAQEIGGIAGVWHNGGENVVLTDCSFTGTLKTNFEDIEFPYGGLVGKSYSATGTGKLIIGGKHYVASAAQLQAALDAATGNSTFYLGANIVGNVTAIQKQGVKVTIEGEDKNFNGVIKVHSNSNHYADAALTIKNVNFETSVASINVIEALENGSERYSCNITVENCSFTATGAAENTAVGLQIKSSKNAKVLNCTATGMHSLIQAQSCDETVVVNGCTINGKNGVAFKQVKAATVEGTTITALEYGIRFDGNTDNYGIVVKNNNVSAVQPLIVRKMTGKNNTIALEGTNTLTTDAEYQIVVTNGSDDEAYVKPTGTYKLTGADDFSVFPAPFPVASWDEFTAALAAGETDIKLTADISYASNYQLQKAVTLNLGGYSMTLPMINIHTKSTVKNGTINGKVYARKNSEIVFDNVKFSGAVADNLSTEGHLAIQGGCKSLYAKDCLFSPTSVSGSQTKPLSFEGGSTIMKFENCEFKSSPYKKQVYLNSLSATGSIDFTNCNFNNKTPNIMFAAACPLTNITMSGTTKLSSVTFEINRAKEAVTDADLAYLRTLIANNSFSSVRLFYAGGSSEYIR